MIIDVPEELAHYGILRKSGRYPWGSGGDTNTTEKRNKKFLDYVSDLRKEGVPDKTIAEAFGLKSSTELRALYSIVREEHKQAQRNMAWRLKEKGMSGVEAAKRMGVPEATYRTLIAPGAGDKKDNLQRISDMLQEEVDTRGMIDVGSGVENYVGISATKLATAVAVLKAKGYTVETIPVRQLGTGKDTRTKVLAPPGTTWGEIVKNRANIQFIGQYSGDGGRTFGRFHDPLIVDPKRLQIVYGKEGAKADGMIFVRPGVDDIALGGNQFAQVRIKVGNDHYLKGMAAYRSDLPDGVDLVFHTPKSDVGSKLDKLELDRVAKPIKDDPMLPFGSLVRQVLDKPDTPDERVTSAMNIVNDTSDWEKWSRSLSSQMLSKQSPTLAKQQLAMTYEARQTRFNEIMSLTNPTVRKKLLEEFAESVDSASVHLKAAALPGQATHVILPLSTIKPTEIYAPNYPNGTRVVLVRHPHGGTFEIPDLVVNNRNREAQRLLGDAKTAVGFHHTVAQRLSGADFDGDTVLVIPDNNRRIITTPALDGLKDFDPVAAYPPYPGMKPIKNMQTEMGMISNLITDMTIGGAPNSEKAAAIRHSMVIIDSEKKNLDYRQSYTDNGIRALKDKYQRKPGSTGRGAATLISRAKSRVDIPEIEPRRPSKGGPVDLATGAKVFEETGRKTPSGNPRMTQTTKLAIATDARTLSSGTRMEEIYAAHSNQLKELANRARLEMVRTPRATYNSSAATAYKPEVAELNAALDLAIRNRPLERQAQLIAGAKVKARLDYNPDMDKETRKKVESQALNDARRTTGASKTDIKVTPQQWEAIQAGAISDSKLTEILRHADMDVVNGLATPKSKKLMTSAKTARATRMLEQGYTREEVANQLGVSLSTLDDATN